MKISNRGISLIRRFEGCRLTAYRCPANVWTIGIGHTGTVYLKAIRAGLRISEKKAISMLKRDVRKFEKRVSKYSKYKWNQNEFDALVSFAFNLGSIDGLTKNGTRSKKEIALKMLLYNKGAGRTLSGLTRRRLEERNLFLEVML